MEWKKRKEDRKKEEKIELGAQGGKQEWKIEMELCI